MLDGYGWTISTGGRGANRFQRAAQIAALAEEAGFGAVSTGELNNRSATVPMAVLGAGTSRVRIGCNIAYGAGRSPLIWPAEARDLDELSEGRIVLGLGNGTRGMLENWLSVSGEAPAARMAELVEVLRKLWRATARGPRPSRRPVLPRAPRAHRRDAGTVPGAAADLDGRGQRRHGPGRREGVAEHRVDRDHLNLAARVWGLSPEDAEHVTRQILAAMTQPAPAGAMP